eukprot:11406373-Heterocapsa_arctica.AAC.1
MRPPESFAASHTGTASVARGSCSAAPGDAFPYHQPFYMSALRRSAAATATDHAPQCGTNADPASAAPQQTAFEILS